LPKRAFWLSYGIFWPVLFWWVLSTSSALFEISVPHSFLAFQDRQSTLYISATSQIFELPPSHASDSIPTISCCVGKTCQRCTLHPCSTYFHATVCSENRPVGLNHHTICGSRGVYWYVLRHSHLDCIVAHRPIISAMLSTISHSVRIAFAGYSQMATGIGVQTPDIMWYANRVNLHWIILLRD
jgi:hypothetical protein